VLELGIGSGLNLRFYSSDVERIIGVDPSAELQRTARERAQETSLAVDFRLQRADQRMDLEDESVDTVVTTWTLCTIPDPGRALQEVKRVLKRSGQVLFLEHGHADEPRVARWQDRITPVWKHLAGGCHLNRPIPELLEDAGFCVGDLETGYLRGPRPMTFTFRGLAVHA
jgi:ubiquinone/menaquinone biosynthesis C-methylase UbiE